MKYLVLASLLLATPAVAGDHGSHPPMAPPLSVTCALKPASEQFDCLHPGYVAVMNRHHDLSSNWQGGECTATGKDSHGCTVCTSYVPRVEIFY